MSVTNLGFGKSPYPQVDPSIFYGGYDPAGAYGDPAAAAPYGGDAGIYGGEEDPMNIQAAGTYAAKGPQFKKAAPKWKKKAGQALDALAMLGQPQAPIQHHQFRTQGLLGRM